MINEEIYILTKHGNFDSNYVENIPIYKRRHFLYLFNKECDEIEKLQEKAKSQNRMR
jgi:hypothetical protein